MPISDMAKLKEIKYNLDLSELMGNIRGQLNQGSIKRVQVECSGTMDETKPAALAFLKGLLKNRVPDRVNYINAEAIAKELGIKVELLKVGAPEEENIVRIRELSCKYAYCADTTVVKEVIVAKIRIANLIIFMSYLLLSKVKY